MGYAPGVGLGTMLHAVPFQCSIRVVMPRPGTSSFSPTAQTSFGATAVTACSVRFRHPQVGYGGEDPAAGFAAPEVHPGLGALGEDRLGERLPEQCGRGSVEVGSHEFLLAGLPA